MKSALGVWLLLAAAQTGDPLAGARRVQGSTTIECSGALETVMLLVQLASSSPARSDFQAQTKTRFALRATHPAVRETAALMDRGLGHAELARLATMMSQAPYFTLVESDELKQMAALLPGGNIDFSLDRLHGYSKLVREFYWDNFLGRYFRSTLPVYQQGVRRPLPGGLPPGAKVLFSALSPVERIEFQRQRPHLILGPVMPSP